MILSPEPFDHVIEDGLFDPDLLDRVLDEFPHPNSSAWGTFDNAHERKQACEERAAMGEATDALLDMLLAPETCESLGALFGIDELTPSLYGGGYHLIPSGGYLGMHVDFNVGQDGLYRRLNHLVFLNHGYEPEFGGQLLLGQSGEVSIEPRFNRTAVFATSDHSWHGHPTPWAGPEPRRSVAVYYYSPQPPDDSPERSTIFAEYVQ